MAPDGASGAGSVIATSFGLPPLGAVPAGRRPGGAERVDGLGELQDLGGQGQQLLVLLLFFLDRLPLVVGQNLAFLVGPVLADHDKGRQEDRLRMSRPPWKFGGGPGADQAAASSLVGGTVAIVASRVARSAGRCR
jgi:hypothetical protein